MTHMAELVGAGGGIPDCGLAGDAGRERIRLLGSCHGLPAPLIYRKAWALLGFLAVETNRRHSRSALARLLWPGFAETSALTNLRQVLSNLNRYCVQVLGPGVLQIERATVGLMRGEQPVFDIDLLRQAPCEPMELLTGQCSFLDGMEDLGGPDFHSWLETTRRKLDMQLVDAAKQYCDAMLEAQRWEPAVEVARALTLRDPWNEAHTRRMMRAHAGSGRHTAALDVYRTIETMLRVELGLNPGQETLQLLAQISDGALPCAQPRERLAAAVA